MTQALDPNWWLSFAGEVWPWWLACALLGLVAWPLTVRVFEGLTDSGAGLSVGIGVIATAWLAWALAHPYFGKSIVARALFAAAGVGLLALDRRRRRAGTGSRTLAVVGALLASLGLVYLPHTRASVAFCAVVVAALSAAVALGQSDRGRSALRRSLAPFLVGQVLFAVGFLFFVNVRTYLPWATFDLALFQAEKAGNLMHLNNAMRATTMPPSDAWFLGEPENYYYAGHAMIAALAKLTATPARIAFNLGLATVFALTLSMGFSLCYSMAVASIPPWRRDALWHRGMAWGLLGALAIAGFGNLDAWRQLGKRSPEEARQALEQRLVEGVRRARSASEIEALDAQAARLRSMTLEQLRWSAQNLKTVDFWKSSRAIHGAPANVKDDGTITEFPFFTALLGDLHPHHMALPFSIAAMAACLALLRLMLARPATSELDWLQRGGPAAAAMGFLTGAVLPVNIWDSIVLAVLYLIVIVASRRGVAPDPRWRWLLYGALAVAFSWIAALLVNCVARVPALGTPGLFLLGLAVTLAAPVEDEWLATHLRRLCPRSVVWGAGLALAALGGVITGFRDDAGLVTGIVAGLRDAAIVGGAVFTAHVIAVRRMRSDTAWWISALGAYGGVGTLGVAVALPFLLTFRSPLSGHLFERPLPPILSPSVLSGPDPLVTRIWSALPINPFPAVLRSEMVDELAHWGLFAVPLTAYLLLLLFRAVVKRPRTTLAWICGFAALGAVSLAALDGYWAGALAITLAGLALWLASLPRTPADDVPILVFVAAGFFWCWFVEALHFDDAYGGIPLERYNTPFKIFFPLWPMLGAATVAALRRLSPPVRVPSLPGWSVLKSPGFWTVVTLTAMVGAYSLERAALRPVGIAIGLALGVATIGHLVRFAISALRRPPAPPATVDTPVATVPAAEVAPLQVPPTRPAVRVAFTEFPAVAPALLLCLLGALYPFAALAVRTRSFFGEPIEGTWMDDPNGERVREFYTRRTLDSLAWYGQTKRYADDLSVIEWLIANGRTGSVILEAPGEGAYTPEGRVSSMTGLPTLVGWQHHENQWRGWEDPLPLHLQRRFFDELKDLLPGLGLPAALPRDTELAIYRASLDGRGALREKLAAPFPAASSHEIDRYADTVLETRQKNLSSYALTQKLIARMAEIYRAPELDDHVRATMRMYQIRYVFVGALEREHFGATLGKFESLPVLFRNGRSAVYEVPQS